MLTVGIDPGFAIVGVGFVEFQNNKFRSVEHGAIITPATMPFSQRLEQIYDELCFLLEKYRPEYASVEKLFFQNNQKTAIQVAEARGVILLALKKYNVKLYEYTPLQVKSAMVGFGKAEKYQVMEMTKKLLGLAKVPKPDDTADALALAICHSQLMRRSVY